MVIPFFMQSDGGGGGVNRGIGVCFRSMPFLAIACNDVYHSRPWYHFGVNGVWRAGVLNIFRMKIYLRKRMTLSKQKRKSYYISYPLPLSRFNPNFSSCPALLPPRAGLLHAPLIGWWICAAVRKWNPYFASLNLTRDYVFERNWVKWKRRWWKY